MILHQELSWSRVLIEMFIKEKIFALIGTVLLTHRGTHLKEELAGI